MGVYIYTARKTGWFKAEVNGERVTIAPMKYLGRVVHEEWSGIGAKWYRMQQAQIARACQVWNGLANPPKFIAVVGDNGPAEGTPVILFNGNPVWYDCDAYPGEVVGFLTKIGHRYGRPAWAVRQHYAVYHTPEESRTLVQGSLFESESQVWEPTYPKAGWYLHGRDDKRVFMSSELRAREVIEKLG